MASLTSVLNRKAVNAFAFSGLLNEDDARLFELTKA